MLVGSYVAEIYFGYCRYEVDINLYGAYNICKIAIKKEKVKRRQNVMMNNRKSIDVDKK